MRGFQINPETNDLDLDDRGKLVRVDGIEAAAQEIRARWQLFRGEYFLDLRQGVPWFQQILGKQASAEARIREAARRVIQTVEGVVDVPDVRVTVNRATREATVAFEARFRDGRVVSDTLEVLG